MERKIEIGAGENLESVVYTLLAAKARGEHVYCDYFGHELHSDSVTMDSAYITVMGCTREEYAKKEKEWVEKEKARQLREQGYAEKVKASRTGERKAITSEEVINGLKFIAEHQSMDQEELIDGLLKLGCNFSLEDIKRQFPGNELLFEGISSGDLGTGAVVIVNARDREYGRAYCKERLLSVDDNFSIYHFIRVTTGDKTYTKEMVDSLSHKNPVHK